MQAPPGYKPRTDASAIARQWLSGGEVAGMLDRVPEEYRDLVAVMARSGCQIIDHWARRVYRDKSVMVPRSIRAAVNRRVKFYEGKYPPVR